MKFFSLKLLMFLFYFRVIPFKIMWESKTGFQTSPVQQIYSHFSNLSYEPSTIIMIMELFKNTNLSYPHTFIIMESPLLNYIKYFVGSFKMQQYNLQKLIWKHTLNISSKFKPQNIRKYLNNNYLINRFTNNL